MEIQREGTSSIKMNEQAAADYHKSMMDNQFRLWDLSRNCFEYHQDGLRQFLIGLNGEVFDGNGNRYDEKFVIHRYAGIISQWNDLIFEGDIVQYYIGSGFSMQGPYVKIVEHRDREWVFVDYENIEQTSPIFQMEDIEIIGNIYEGIID